MKKLLTNTSTIGFVLFTVLVIILSMFAVAIYAVKQTSDQSERNTVRIMNYQRCVSLTRYQNGDNAITPEQIDRCQR